MYTGIRRILSSFFKYHVYTVHFVMSQLIYDFDYSKYKIIRMYKRRFLKKFNLKLFSYYRHVFYSNNRLGIRNIFVPIALLSIYVLILDDHT